MNAAHCLPSALACLLLCAAAAAQKPVPEPRAGLACRVPKGWVELPGGGDRGATLRLWAAPRALASRGEATHTPLLRVMFFAKGGDAAKDVVDGLPRRTPFRSLEDFARRGLGMQDVQQEAGKAGAFAGRKLVGRSKDDHVLIGHSFALDDGECGVCFEVLGNHADKLKKEFEATFASLEQVARTAARRSDPPWVADAAWAGKDAAARAAARRKWAEDMVAATAKAPEAGFKVQASKYWTVLSAADPAFTKKAIAAAEVMRAFCAQKLPELTKDQPLPAVLRIFDSPDHYQACVATGNLQREYDAGRRELLFARDPDLGGSAAFGMLFRAVLWQVFDDVDPRVLDALPRWLDNGCWEFLRSSQFDGKKIEFAPSDVERGRIEYQQRGNSMPAVWHLIQESIQPSPEDGAKEQDWGYTPECARLLRWLLLYDGLQAFGKPNLLADYVRGIGAAVAQVGADPTLDVAVGSLSADEQKETNKRYYKWRDALVKQVDDTVLPLPVKTWEGINARWLEFNKNLK